MEAKANYAIAGIFIILLTAAAIGIGSWLAFGDVTTAYRTYQAYMEESVSGLYVDAPVRYHGVEVGKVRGMALDPAGFERVLLTLDIEAEVPIHTDTIATLSVQGLTGIASIELTGGSPQSPLLEVLPGEAYPILQTGPSLFMRLDNALSETFTNLNQVATDLHAVLSDTQGTPIQEIVDNVHVLTRTLADRRDEIDQGLADAARMLENSARASEQLPQLLREVQTGVHSVQQMADQLGRTGNVVEQTLAGARADLNRLGERNQPQLDSLMSELERLSVSMRQLSERLEENPRLLLYGTSTQPRGPGE